MKETKVRIHGWGNKSLMIIEFDWLTHLWSFQNANRDLRD